jgi:phage baseplate assembly protein W
MRSFQITNGDLTLGTNNSLSLVVGKSKLLQDLTLWLEEPIGTGYTTPNFGSILNTFIGSSNPQVQMAQVQAEVQRVLGLYQAQQKNRLQQMQSRGQLASWNKSEIISSISQINTVAQGSSVILTIQVTTLNNTTTSIDMFVSANGVQVASTIPSNT